MRVDIRKIGHSFGDTKVLRDVSLSVEDGELLSILGPSGCGKTTLLRIVAGLLAPDTGSILFDGRDVTDVPPEKREVGMVFQNYALFPNMTVEDNIAFGLVMKRWPKDRVKERVREVTELVNLTGYEKRRPGNLSGGEMQRVALARALAPDTKLLLLDEPLSALDAKLRQSLRREIKRIQRETGITALYVTHDQEEALSLSHGIAVMNEGRIEQVGTPEDIYSHPETEFVASFVGEANMLEGAVRGDVIESALGEIPIRNQAKGKVWVMVRPEDVLFDEAEEALSFTGTIKSMENRGGEVHGVLEVKGKEGQEIRFRRYLRDIRGEVGDSVRVFIPFSGVEIIDRKD